MPSLKKQTVYITGEGEQQLPQIKQRDMTTYCARTNLFTGHASESKIEVQYCHSIFLFRVLLVQNSYTMK